MKNGIIFYLIIFLFMLVLLISKALIMHLMNLFNDYSVNTLLTLIVFSFIAGFIDSVAGGGGLVQLPALLINLPNSSIATIFGTNKIAGFSGTSIAAYRYSRKVSYNFKLLVPVSICAVIGGFTGAKILNYIDANSLKPFILIILFIIAVYTAIKKDFGAIQTKSLPLKKQIVFGSLLGIIIGIYDGFFGPGTGSFLMLGFVLILGFEFIEASAYSKFVNAITNIGALVVFIRHGNFILGLAIIMALCNILGSLLGSHLAIKRGNNFIRVIFMFIVFIMIIRYGYDIYKMMG
jgi:uncharacterized protein